MERIEGHNKPKLLFLVTEDWYFVSHRLSLAVAAREAGYDVAVATRARQHVEMIQRAGVRVIPFELSRRAGNPVLELLRLLSLYRREHPDIVHHVALKPVFLGALAARLAGIPAQVNAVAGLGWLGIFQDRKARWLSLSIRWILARLLNTPHCRVIVQNPDDAELLKEAGVTESHLRMIRGSGVDTSEFSPFPEPPEPICVVLASRILWDKGVGEFVEAARQLKKEGVKVIPEIMIPLVGHVGEVRDQKAVIDRVATETMQAEGVKVKYLVGTMIEVPRGVLAAGEIAADVDFFSFGTNDLTQLTFGFSRDDIGKFLRIYQQKKILVLMCFT